MSTVKYLLDENVNPLFRSGLLRREPSMVVWRVGSPGAPPDGTLDPQILYWCEEHDFILVTNNRTSMPAHLRDHLAEGHHILGIIQLNQNMSIAETLEELCLIWALSEEGEYRDRIPATQLSLAPSCYLESPLSQSGIFFGL